ncbi:hypothetical protein F5887DRAFT_1084538 [Amanita rubescens]|nr:hypothetical protein F5887DRAFT_1084538 [Amanita rubescens]
MKDNYDTKGASERLEEIAMERSISSHAGIQLADLTNSTNWTSKYRVYQSNHNSNIWHLVYAKDNIALVDPAELEEVVVTIQGVLWQHDLPPFTETIRRQTANRTRFLRQTVTLTGFGTERFEKCIKTIGKIQSIFERHIPEDKLQESTIIGNCDEHLGLHFTNRYFTNKHHEPYAQQIPFTSDIDPSGILAGLVNNNFIHCEQNEVKYYNRQMDIKDAIKYETIAPVRFRVGDIVEVKATLMLVPLRGGMYKLNAVLRSYLPLNTQSLSQNDTDTRTKKLKQNTRLKRNIDYYKEEEKVTMRRRVDGERDDDGAENTRKEIADVIPISQGETNPMAVD